MDFCGGSFSFGFFLGLLSLYLQTSDMGREAEKTGATHTHTHHIYKHTHTEKWKKKKFLFSRRHGRVVDNKKPRGPIQQKTMTPSPSKWKKLFNNQTAQQTPARIFRCNRKRIGNKSSWHNHIGTEFAQEHKAHERKKTTRKNKNGQALVFFFLATTSSLDALRSPTGDGRWQPAPLNVAENSQPTSQLPSVYIPTHVHTRSNAASTAVKISPTTLSQKSPLRAISWWWE